MRSTLALVSMLLPTYAAHKFPDYPVRAASDYTVKIERAGLLIGAQPVEDLKEQKTYFKTELTAKGFVPVFIVIQNRSSEDTYLFEKSDVGYGGISSNSTPDAHSKVGQGMAMLGGGGLIAIKLITSATEIQQNILKKEVQSKTLSPGASVHGFLYIPVPKKGPRDQIHIQVPMSKAGTNETYVLNLFL